MNQNFATYVISLPEQLARRRGLLHQLQSMGFAPEVVPALNGHDENFPFNDYRRWATGRWWDKNEFKPGAFACFLSHIECWKIVAASNLSFAIIFEDDAIVDPAGFEKLHDDLRQMEFDLIFINDGMRRLIDNASCITQKTTDFIETGALLIDVLKNNKYHRGFTPGSYGYVISQHGAEKLLRVVERDRICMGVDYAMLFGALSSEELAQIETFDIIPDTLRIYLNNVKETHARSATRMSLSAYVYATTPISHDESHGSTIDHNRLKTFDVFHKDEKVSARRWLRRLLEAARRRNSNSPKH